MEVKKPQRRDDELLAHGDVRMPEVTGIVGAGPSRAQVLLHLAGTGLGLLLLVVGLGLGFSRGIWDRTALLPVIAGGALVAAWITLNYGFLAGVFKNRRVMVGTNAAFMALLGVVLLTMVNFITYRHYRKFDLTEAQINTLSSRTTQILDDLDADVTILLSDRVRSNSSLRIIFDQVEGLLDLYKEGSPHIKVETLSPDVDISKAKMLLERHGITTASAEVLTDEVFVAAAHGNKTLRLRDLCEWSPDPENPMQALPGPFKGEQYISSAIFEVTSEHQPKLYFLTGHGERGMNDAEKPGVSDFAAMLRRDFIAVDELAGIPADGVPEDCECLVILGPEAPLAGAEVDNISRYLDAGGRLLVCIDYDADSGLERLLGRWGIIVGRNVIIPRDASALRDSAASFLALNLSADHDITKPLSGFAVAFDFARSVTAGQSDRGQVVQLVLSSPRAYAETDIARLKTTGVKWFDENADKPGPLGIAAAVAGRKSAPAASGEAASQARVVVLGDVDVFSNKFMGEGARVVNSDLARNAVNWLIDRKALLAIDAKTDRQHILVVDKAALVTVFVLIVVGMPCSVLLLGAFVWAMRSYGSRSS